MARFASQMKMGFYPTPLSVVENIKQHLVFHEKEKIQVYEDDHSSLFGETKNSQNPTDLRLLDPCCGEGVSLSIIAEGTNAVTYGNELQNERYAKASGKLEHVVRCDALSELKTMSGAFSLLWLNPPYDSYGNGEKLETKFLEVQNRFLMKNGILVYIIPALSLREAEPILTAGYKNIRVMPFPDEEYGKFKQIVVIAQKTLPGKAQKSINYKYLTDCINSIRENFDTLYEVLPDTDSVYDSYEVLPSLVQDNRFRFISNRLDPDEMIKLVSGDVVFDKFISLVSKHTQNTNIHPLTSLRKGHLAMLLAGGFLNGEIEKEGKKYCIKGNVYTSNNIVDEEANEKGAVKTTRRISHDIIINMYDYQKNEFMEVKA